MAKKIVHWAWRWALPILFSVALFFLVIAPARAPRGGKNSLGGRTLASFQEEEFDHRLLSLQLCYGVHFNGENATPGRRRVCKALLVHSLDKVLSTPGAMLKYPVEFRCEDTVFPKSQTQADSATSVVSLKPNEEFAAIKEALDKSVETVATTEEQALSARETCGFITDCKWAMRPQALSFRKLASCISTPDITRRKIVLDEFGAMLFRVKGRQGQVLISKLLENRSN
ncbi:MAG: hypothetical protein ACXWQO_12090 [Bdellovibrionota bacterium]